MAGAVDTIGGFRYPRVKVQHGADGTATDVSAASPLPTLDFYTLVSQGLVTNHSLVHKFGRNAALPNGSFGFVSGLGSTSWPLSAATKVRIKAGGNAADTGDGAGAREITVQGIDDSFAEITETITTAGASVSTATTALFWRIHRAWVSSVGTYGAANTAAVVIENSAGGTDVIQIAIEEGQSQFAGWSCPLGATAYLLSVELSVDAVKSADFALYTRENLDDTAAPMSSKRLRKYFDGVRGNHAPAVWRSPGVAIPAKSDIWVEAMGDGAAVEASVDIEILVVTA